MANFDPINDRLDVYSVELAEVAEVTGNVVVKRALMSLGLRTEKSNISGVDPTAANDSSQGYSIGSEWINASTGHIWVATNVTPGAAVWFDNGAASGATSSGVVPPKVVAWGLVDASSGTPTLLAGSGVSSLSIAENPLGGTYYHIQFSNALPDTNFVLNVTCVSQDGQNWSTSVQETYGSRTVDGFTVMITEPTRITHVWTKLNFQVLTMP